MSGQARVHGGRGGVAPPPPLGIGKKDGVRGNFNLFHVLLMKLGGNRYTVQAKWKGGRTDACP